MAAAFLTRHYRKALTVWPVATATCLSVCAAGPAVDQEAERDVQPVRLADTAPRPPGGAGHRQHHGPAGEDPHQPRGQQAGEGTEVKGHHDTRGTLSSSHGEHEHELKDDFMIPAEFTAALPKGRRRGHFWPFKRFDVALKQTNSRMEQRQFIIFQL